MTSPGQLSKVVAGILGKPLPTVIAFDNQLVNAGLRTAGGRGKSAAKITSRDAAALLIVSIASPSIKDTVPTLEKYWSLWAKRGQLASRMKDHPRTIPDSLGQAWDLRFSAIPNVTRLGSNHTFSAFLIEIIEAAKTGELALNRPMVGVTLRLPWIGVRVSIANEIFAETRSYNVKGSKAIYLGPEASDLLTEFTISSRTIHAIGDCLRD